MDLKDKNKVELKNITDDYPRMELRYNFKEQPEIEQEEGESRGLN